MTDPASEDQQSSELNGLERAIEFALFTPFTVGARAIEELPDVVRRTRQHLTLARMIGMMAVNQGTVELKRRIEASVGDRTSPADADAGAGAEPAGNVEVEELSEVDDVVTDDRLVPPVDDLALPDYDHLPAAHIVEKLATLSDDERDLIESYETANRHRRTVLGKIEQLRARAAE